MEVLTSDPVVFSVALFAFTLVIAFPAAIILTLVVMRLFRSRVEHYMRPDEPPTSVPVPPLLCERRPTSDPLTIEYIDPNQESAKSKRAPPLPARMQRQRYRLAAIYATAASMFPLTIGLVLTIKNYPSPDNRMVLVFVTLWALFFLINSAPAVLAPTVALKKRLRSQFFSIAVLFILVALWAATMRTNTVSLWLQVAGVPTAMVLLMNTRRVRAIGPLALTVALTIIYSGVIGFMFVTLQALAQIGPWRLVSRDPLYLPFSDVVFQFFDKFQRIHLGQMVAEVNAFVDSPLDYIQPANLGALDFDSWDFKLYFYGIGIGATALGMVLSWIFVSWLARSYRDRQASDQMLILDVMLMIYTIWTFLLFLTIYDWIVGVCVIVGFAAYKFVLQWLLTRIRNQSDSGKTYTLLLLRVFGYGQRTQLLLDDLGQRWRTVGPIQLIGGADSVNATIEPHEVFQFLNGKLSNSFINKREDVERRLSGRYATPDPDGLFRIDDFYCHDDNWQMTVSLLAPAANAVLMDLRSFSADNRGCIAEIEQLVATVPLDRVVLLIDRSSNIAVIDQTLRNAFNSLPGNSPNVGDNKLRIRILRASSQQRRTLDSLLGLLCDNL